MDDKIVRVFDVFEQAQQARDALLGAGFADVDVQLSVRDDEAGPVQGNFTVGDCNPAATDHHEDPYERKYAHPVQRGSIMLVVEAPGAAGLAAAEIMRRFGGRPVP